MEVRGSVEAVASTLLRHCGCLLVSQSGNGLVPERQLGVHRREVSRSRYQKSAPNRPIPAGDRQRRSNVGSLSDAAHCEKRCDFRHFFTLRATVSDVGSRCIFRIGPARATDSERGKSISFRHPTLRIAGAKILGIPGLDDISQRRKRFRRCSDTAPTPRRLVTGFPSRSFSMANNRASRNRSFVSICLCKSRPAGSRHPELLPV